MIRPNLPPEQLSEDTPLLDRTRFDGATFDDLLDGVRLNKQLRLVWSVIRDGEWRTAAEVARAAGIPIERVGSVGARIRDFRKDRFGGLNVPCRRRGDPRDGVWEYRVVR